MTPFIDDFNDPFKQLGGPTLVLPPSLQSKVLCCPLKEGDPPVLTAHLYDPGVLSNSDMNLLLRCTLPVYLDGFMHAPPDAEREAAFRMDLASHLKDTERLVLITDENSSTCGFLCGSLRRSPHGRIYHLEGLIIASAFQGRGIGLAAVSAELLETGADLLAFHTQSSHMLRLGQKLAEISPETARLIAREIPHRNLQGPVDVARYGGTSLYGDVMRFAGIAIPSIDVHRGDAVFAAGFVKKEEV